MTLRGVSKRHANADIGHTFTGKVTASDDIRPDRGEKEDMLVEKVKEDFDAIRAANRELIEHQRAKKGRRGDAHVGVLRVHPCPECGGPATLSGAMEAYSDRTFRCRDAKGCKTRGTWTENPDGTVRMQISGRRVCIADGCEELTGSKSPYCDEHRPGRKRTDTAVRLMSLAEAADRMGVSLTTLRNIIGRGELTTVMVGRRRLVQQSELRRYIKERTTS